MSNSTHSPVRRTSSDEVVSPTSWSVRITRVDTGQIFGALPRAAPHRFQYITVTLEYVYHGAGNADLFPETIALMCVGTSPLQGLTQTPRLFFDEDSVEVILMDAQSVRLRVEANRLYRATLVYEFHQDCREFRLYFPECDSLGVNLP